MKSNKNITMVSCLLTLFGNGAQVFAGCGNLGDRADLAITCDTSRLPDKFRKKFKLGDYIIDESDGDIRINYCDMDDRDLPNLVECIRNGNVQDFWVQDTESDADRTIIYLQVGNGVYFYPELFEKLIIARNGEIRLDMLHGYRVPFSDRFSEIWTEAYDIKDDRNIVQKLNEAQELGEAFKKGKAKIYIYHRGCNSLTSLHFDRHDEQVSSIDHRRAIFTKVKGIAQWATCWGTGKLTCSFLGHMPILGVVLGGVVGVATSVAGVIALYKTYDSFCPTEVKRSINAFWKKKARSFAPMLNTWLRDFYRDSRGVYPLAPEDPPSWTPASSR